MKTSLPSQEIKRIPNALKLARAGRRRGSAILAAIMIVAIVAAMVGVAFVGTNSAIRMGGQAKDYITAQRAAEATVEYGYGIWKKRIFAANRAITTAEASANLSVTVLPGFAYDTVANNGPLAITATDQYGAPAASPTAVQISLLDYPGWRGFTSSYLVSAKLVSVGQRGSIETVGVRRRFQYVEVPIFQTMYFYQHDLEFYKPATMIVSGIVHTNSNLYASSSSSGTLTFTGNVSYVNNYSTDDDPPYANTWSGWSANAEQLPTYPNGESNQVTKVQAAQPMGLALSSLFNTGDTNTNNDGYREIIEQPVAGYSDPSEIAVRRMSSKAGIVMKINGTSATVTTQNGTTVPPATLASIQAAFTGKTTMYDQREGKTVDVANVDVSRLTTALNTGGVTGFNGVLYVVDNTPVTTSGASPSPNPKTVRLQKGGILPDNGLTVASQNPVYVQGDYNTGASTLVLPTLVPSNLTGNPNNTDSPTALGYTRKPAAVMADAVMLLSNSWNDANSSLAVASRVASNTTYNMAILAGFMPSGFQPASGSQYGYSGGGNNFPRFLETWSGKTCTYYGSMVELFQSAMFTGKWDTGNIYSPPLRRWNFDTNFTTNPPPGSLIAVLYSRGSWSKF